MRLVLTIARQTGGNRFHNSKNVSFIICNAILLFNYGMKLQLQDLQVLYSSATIKQNSQLYLLIII